jgi:nucleotide-binding universal stress UspA family protein
MKSILVPISGSATDEPVIEAALCAARLFSSHLEFVHVHVGAGEAALNLPHTGFAMGPALSGALKELDRKAATRSATAAQHFRDLCAQSRIEICDAPGNAQGVTASWHEADGHALRRIMFGARHSDLVVVGRAKKPNGLPADYLEQLLVGCGRPILIAASTPRRTLTGTIMVCWRETAEAARAVSCAMPLLMNAKRVVAVTVAERNEDQAGSMAQLARHLAWNGISAEVQIIKAEGGGPPQLLVAAAQACEADLVVLGAYGHSQLRELLFGGCTQSFLRDADRPVLMMH